MTRRKNTNCRHFVGEKPCRRNRLCDPKKCGDFSGYGKRILIIKFDAIGDVLRTTPVLPALKKRYKNCNISWLTTRQSREALESNPYIDRLMVFNLDTVLRLLVEKFDLLISVDKASAAISLAMLVDSKKKLGFGMDKNGKLTYFNKASQYAFRLGFDDELKFRKNRKTYQAIVFDMCGLGGKYGEYIFDTAKSDEKHAKSLLKRWNIRKGDRVIGLNTGAGRVFLTKKWSEDSYVRLADLLYKKNKTRVLLLGGPDEIEINKYIESKSSAPVINTGNNHTIKQFTELIGLCDLIVSSDTLAMHLAIARKVPVVALFGSTTPHEVDLYGRGVKLFADVKCAPCYKSACKDGACMRAITPKMVFDKCAELLK